MTSFIKPNPNRIARRAGKQGARSSVENQAEIEKSDTGSKEQLLKCKRPLLLSTFNVNTLNATTKMGELTSSADIICIQEHRIYHDESIRHQNMGKGWMLITSSAEKAVNNATVRGALVYWSAPNHTAHLKGKATNFFRA